MAQQNSRTIAPSSALDASSTCLHEVFSEEEMEDLTRNAREVEMKQKKSIALNMKHVLHDSELDQFMEAYETILLKCKEKLERPLMEATEFIQMANSQLNSLTNGSMHAFSAVLYVVDRQSDICNVQEEEKLMKRRNCRFFG